MQDMIDVFNAGNARSYISEFRFPNHILSETWDAKSRVYNLHKDVGMAIAFADKLGANVNLGRDTLAYLKQAMALGMEDTDFSLIYQDFEKVADF